MSTTRSEALLVLQHAACEPPGVYEDELRSRGIAIERSIVAEADELPDWEGFAGILVMGGAMGAHDEDSHPWLAAEKRLIGEAVDAGTPYWGVCLGAQLLAASLGAGVAPGPLAELGVMDVELTAAAARDPVFAAAPRRFPTLQWHRDSYELPAGAVRLARSERYEQQAFSLGSAYAVQFHLEVDQRLAARWMEIPAYVEELEQLAGPGAAVSMLAQVRAAEARTVPLARALFGRWLTAVAGLTG
jgi:GMP synthase (glutamine-hydrolysing)